MRVSVVVCTYDPGMYEHLVDAVGSVLAQSHPDVEVIIVVDGDHDLHERVRGNYGEHERVTVRFNEQNLGLSVSRNEAIDVATGDVVAFLDDDAVAEPDWVAELVSVYESTDAIAVGGRMVGEWVGGEPEFLPAEFYWLVGVTHRGFAAPGEEVRNTFGSNISFRRAVLDELGGFRPDVGRHGEKPLQAEEPEFCIRMRERYGQGVIYHPDAVVRHKVFAWRLGMRWLARRAFWQGYSKRVVDTLQSGTGVEEATFLRKLVFEFIPDRTRRLGTSFSTAGVKQLIAIGVLTGFVGAGYLYALVRTVGREMETESHR